VAQGSCKRAKRGSSSTDDPVPVAARKLFAEDHSDSDMADEVLLVCSN
jgi:hypothetical protein